MLLVQLAFSRPPNIIFIMMDDVGTYILSSVSLTHICSHVHAIRNIYLLYCCLLMCVTLGHHDVGYNGGPIPTPNLDQLAANVSIT